MKFIGYVLEYLLIFPILFFDISTRKRLYRKSKLITNDQSVITNFLEHVIHAIQSNDRCLMSLYVSIEANLITCLCLDKTTTIFEALN